VDVDVVVDRDGDGDDELHRQSFVSIATMRASSSSPRWSCSGRSADRHLTTSKIAADSMAEPLAIA
jgi:hypothetical protein